MALYILCCDNGRFVSTHSTKKGAIKQAKETTKKFNDFLETNSSYTEYFKILEYKIIDPKKEFFLLINAFKEVVLCTQNRVVFSYEFNSLFGRKPDDMDFENYTVRL